MDGGDAVAVLDPRLQEVHALPRVIRQAVAEQVPVLFGRCLGACVGACALVI